MRQNVVTTLVAIFSLVGLAVFHASGETASARDLTRSEMAGLRGGADDHACQTPDACLNCVPVNGTCTAGNQAACEAISIIACTSPPNKNCIHTGNPIDHCSTPSEDTHTCKSLTRCKWTVVGGWGMCAVSGMIGTPAYTYCDP